MPEEFVVKQCAPTLAGIKTGALFRYPCNSREEVNEEIRKLNKRLSGKGIRVLPLRYAQNSALLYLYRPAQLKKDLFCPQAIELLRSCGYPTHSPELCVGYLIARFQEGGDFPHEVGLFLSYPPEDVRGFMEHKAKDSKLCGCWKVYGDSAQAEKVFASYKRCTEIYCARCANGTSIEHLTVAV